jgi:hypothetical protein
MENGTGSWNVAWNWAEGVPNSVGAHARFVGNVSSATTVTSDTPVTVGQVTFNSPFSYTLAGGGTLNLDVTSGSASISVNQGTHTIAMPVSIADNATINTASLTRLSLTGPVTLANGSAMTKSGAGTVELSGPVTSSAGASVRTAAGTLRVMSDLNGAALFADGGLTRLDATQHVASVSVAAGAEVVLSDAASSRIVRAGSLVVSGKFDITDNGVAVDYSGASPIGTIASAIAAGFNGGAWNGQGIVSANAAMAGATVMGVGYAEASALASLPVIFGGESIDGTTILVVYTLAGDANLDRAVNSADFNVLASQFGLSNNRLWTEADSNYDGAVNGSDFNLLATNFGQSIGTAAPGSAVPEPSVLASVLAFSLAARQRRQMR